MSGYQRHFRQQVALGNLLLLFRYSDGVACTPNGVLPLEEMDLIKKHLAVLLFY
jgi:hypothetical protein